MQRLSGTDAGFLYGETAAWHMHAGVVVVLDPSTAPAGFGLDALREVIRQRLPQLGLFRYRVSAAPLGIGGSYWVEVPDVDLEAHVQAASLPAPGGMRELAAFTADVFSRKLDRRRPLWEMWLVDSLEGGLRRARDQGPPRLCRRRPRRTAVRRALRSHARCPARTRGRRRTLVRTGSVMRGVVVRDGGGDRDGRRCVPAGRCARLPSAGVSAPPASRDRASVSTSRCRSQRRAADSTVR